MRDVEDAEGIFPPICTSGALYSLQAGRAPKGIIRG